MAARLQGAFLGEAQLQGANLEHAQFQEAVLREAQLQGANLRYAQLQEAVLREAQLQGATLWQTQMQETDLDHAQLQGVSSQEANHLSSTEFESEIENRIGKPSDLTGMIFVGELPSSTETGAYTQEEAKQWISEYQAAMRDIPKRDES